MDVQSISHWTWQWFNNRELPFFTRLLALASMAMLSFGCMPDIELKETSVKPADSGAAVTLTPAAVEDVAEALADTGQPFSFTLGDLPPFLFESSGPGELVSSGGCLLENDEVVAGDNAVFFSVDQPGSYDGCSIRVRSENGVMSEPLAVPPFVVVAPVYSNDTGVRYCGDYAYATRGSHDNDLDCLLAGATRDIDGVDGQGDVVAAGQDALFGRDADPALNDDADGYSGFSFTKLDGNGQPLAFQDRRWRTDGSEADGSQWQCVIDNVTGLVWEVKRRDGGLQDYQGSYSWFEPSASNGGYAGVAAAGSCDGLASCDTAAYVAAVNAAGLCGFDDWRLPDSEELLSIVNKQRVSPALDERFFPNTDAAYYWTNNSYSADVSRAWLVNFYLGYEYIMAKQTAARIRLVRASH
ncbi:MAG TPA: DUF1566 domain-containing protein [Pseudomonadales bacterium]